MAKEKSTKTKELEVKALSWPDRAKSLKIIDQTSYDEAADFLRRVKNLRDEVIEHHKPIKAAAFKAHQEACNAEKKLLAPLTTAEKILKEALLAWEREQERIRLANERKLEAERQAEADEARRLLAEEVAAGGASQDELDAIIDEEAFTPTVVAAPPTFTRNKAISKREIWSAEVTDLRVLCTAIGMGKVPATLVQPNAVALNGLARSLKEGFAVPGCKVIKKESAAVR